ncbi:hypothetical protein EMCG_02175 [[Emmonsia] crescens]|uniref:Uncharacterized protein n=1 Tax=[Emmonsia] crescens TaxID=73230 RepID=A0A0G2J980_9EURO|nr:hypothetical protein EMCG_02175 [Emmonsia crescens UAMH 3008]
MISSLLRGPKIRILHANAEDETPQPIYDTYPKWLAMHFSDLLMDCFPDEHEAHVPRKGCNGTDTVTIYGGVKHAHLVVFRWMLACCKGTGVAKIDWLPFAKYIRILEAAEILHVEPVQEDMWGRMQRMAQKQVHIDDVRMVYLNYHKSSPVRQLVIRSIGDAVFERRLRNFGAYKVFKSECGEYEADIYEYLRGKRREVYEEQQRAARAAARKANKADRKLSAKIGGDGGRQTYGQIGAKVTAAAAAAVAAVAGRGDGVVNPVAAGQVVSKTISAVVTRKARGGRPGYAKVHLSDLGVSNTQFTGYRNTAGMAQTRHTHAQ